MDKKKLIIFGSVLLYVLPIAFFSYLKITYDHSLDDKVASVMERKTSGNQKEYAQSIDEKKPETTNVNKIKSPVSMSFVGDILIDRSVAKLIDTNGTDFMLADVFASLKSDIFMANLENPISTRGDKQVKDFTFRMKPEYVNVLKAAGVNIVTLANNHALDYGQEAFVDTLKALKNNKIKFVGAGENIEKASEFEYFEMNGFKIAFVAGSQVIPYTNWSADAKNMGVANVKNPSKMIEEIKEAKKTADIVVAYIHWGEELKPKPNLQQSNLAKMLVDAGCDLVIGAHPHVLQGMEYYKDKLIVYSLGNFIFTDTSRETMILKVNVDNNGKLTAKMIPTVVLKNRPTIIRDEKWKNKIFSKISTLSNGVKVDKSGNITEK